MTMKNAVFWDLAPCRSHVNRRFGGTYRLHLQGRKIRERWTSLSRWLQAFFTIQDVQQQPFCSGQLEYYWKWQYSGLMEYNCAILRREQHAVIMFPRTSAEYDIFYVGNHEFSVESSQAWRITWRYSGFGTYWLYGHRILVQISSHFTLNTLISSTSKLIARMHSYVVLQVMWTFDRIRADTMPVSKTRVRINVKPDLRNENFVLNWCSAVAKLQGQSNRKDALYPWFN
jgi:hypothetical protein